MLRSGSEKHPYEGLGFSARAYHGRGDSGESSTRAAKRREGDRRSGCLAHSADLQIPGKAWRNRNRRAAPVLQYGRGNDRDCALGIREGSRGRPEATAREILPDRANRARGYRESAAGGFGGCELI